MRHARTGAAAGRLAALALALAAAGPSCGGYHALTDPPGRIRSACVVPFRNRTLYDRLEFELQDVLIKELNAKSGLDIVRQESADGVLEGEIVDYARAVLKQDPGGRDIEFQIAVMADFVLKERRTGRVLSEQRGVSVSKPYLVSHGETEEAARARAMSDLAERIVSMILYRW